jgi:hypothetical protein
MEADLSTLGSLPTWELAHIFEHTRLADRASRAGKPVPAYPLDFSFTPAWLFLHNEQHRAHRIQLNIPETYDFGTLDPNDPADLRSWLQAHYLEHQALSAASP